MRQRIIEAVGVPANIEVAAQNLYNDIAKKLKNKKIGPEDVVKFKFLNKDGKYSFADFNPKFITVDFSLGSYSGDAIDNISGDKITGGLVHSMGFSRTSKLNDVFDLVSVDTDGSIELSIDYAQPDMNLLNITYSEVSAEHKHHHILELNREDEWQGNFALMPNNKILFNLPNFTVKDQIPDYKTNMDYPSVETDSWSTSDDDSFYYKIKN